MEKYECGVCRERNPLSNTRCSRCDHILPWGFLHDPSLIVVEKVKTPRWARWLDLFFNPNYEPPKCRYCGEGIAAEALVCPHCFQILMVRINEPMGPAALGGFVLGGEFGSGAEVSESSELRALIQRFLADHPKGY